MVPGSIKTGEVAVIMGSQSDWPTLSLACDVLDKFEVDNTVHIVSAHRTPARLYDFVSKLHEGNTRIIIAGAGGAAHLPGMAAALTPLPVIAVPVMSKSLNGVDSLLSIVQMPKGVAVATQAIGEPGAYNAGLLAVQMLSIHNQSLHEKLVEFKDQQSREIPMEVSR